MLRFEHIAYLNALFLVPVLVVFFVLYMAWRKRALKRFGDLEITGRLMPLRSESRQVFKFILLITAYCFLVIGAANPQMGSKLEKVQRKGSDLVIALDVSNSMLCQDIRPDRLTRAKQALSRLIDNLEGDRIGIVIFAGKAYIQLPITADYAAAKMFLNTINTNIVPSQGTVIGDAIDLGIQSFTQTDRGRAVIIITDGENHEGDAVQSAAKAAEQGIRIYTVGMGSAEGAPIPVFDQSGRQTGFKKDKQGQTIITRLNETMLQQIASAGNGIYVRASTGRDGVSAIFDEINALEKTEIETRMFADYESRYQYFLAIALILLVAEMTLSWRRSRWAGRINLFKP
jgi:Ca-activated chloride channel family protein